MKVLIVGGTGMLGHKAVQVLRERFNVYATIRSDFQAVERLQLFDEARTFTNVDVEAPERLREIVRELKPNCILNAVGIIKQLESSKNVIKTLTVNSIFPHRLAEYAAENGARVITVSTDCVFRGDKGNYTEGDFSDATDVYGKSKNLGELHAAHCLTLRTSIIGREIGGAHSLVEWFLSNRGKQVKGYTNAIYSGLPTIVLAELLGDLIADHPNLHGLYHVASRPINKYDLLKLIEKKFAARIDVEPFHEFRVDRSLNQTKFKNATGFVAPEWTEMIERMANDPTPYEDWRKSKNAE